MPLKMSRREIATNMPQSSGCAHSRNSVSIDELSRPGGSIINSAVTGDVSKSGGLVNVIESPKPLDLTQTYGCNGAATSYTCTEQNARRRCRSSGIIKRTYDQARSEIAYFTNTNQYLVSRSKTFLQNQYRHVRLNDVSIVTNPLVSKEVYSPNGISHCPKTVIHTALTFSYYWINADFTGEVDPTPYEVTIPPGSYDVRDFNSAFESAMIANTHYFVYSSTYAKVFLMKIIYNNTNGKLEIQSFPSDAVNNATYSIPINSDWSIPEVSTVPVFEFPPTAIQTIVGFSAGRYPNTTLTSNANQSEQSIGFLSNLSHSLYPSYSIVNYKPSNNRFATQGGVSSSDMTVRVKYETITRNVLATSATMGSHVGNAMSYGVSEQPYTLKDRIGYPVNKTPVIDKYTGQLKCKENGRLVGHCSSAPSG